VIREIQIFKTIFILCIMLFLYAIFYKVHAHDIYTSLRSPAGQLCCGEKDCERIYGNYRQSNGMYYFYSGWYKVEIAVPEHRVIFAAVPGGEDSEAHWCGIPREHTQTKLYEDNPDPKFITYCAFIMPGGV
jgi:hypothetical protein